MGDYCQYQVDENFSKFMAQLVKKLSFFLGMLKEVTVILFLGLAVWAYQATQPPPPKICGTLGGPPITAPRMKLRDGRHLSYKEHGVSKETAKAKIILVHGFASTKHDIMSMTEPVLVIYF